MTTRAETAPPRAGAPAFREVSPSGRVVAYEERGGDGLLTVRAPGGELEVEVRFTPDGPVVRVRGGRLEIASPGEVALSCRTFEVAAGEEIRFAAEGGVHIEAGELRARTEESIHLNGKTVRLNCPEESSATE
ncbi:MAG TPA: hypothetical protein VIL46_17925 [Gemmataceae bacterium]